VAELAFESCAGDPEALFRLVRWLSQAQPEAACRAWQHAGQPELPPSVSEAIRSQWLPRMTDADQEPAAVARAAIGRALGLFGLDNRPGVGLRPDGLPDIEWVSIPAGWFLHGENKRPASLPAFEFARYPVTHVQFKAFVDDGGYQEKRWWQGLAKQSDAPAEASWTEPNSPRETVNWYDAVAFCRWLDARLGSVPGRQIRLPSEREWERAARNVDGRTYPWGDAEPNGKANFGAHAGESLSPEQKVGRTSAVGIFAVANGDAIADLAGNVFEWCVDAHDKPGKLNPGKDVSRVLRGGSWNNNSGYLRPAVRGGNLGVLRYDFIGFRLCRSCPVEKPATARLRAGTWKR
jgi:formylglycine-generating enzyme required for sulfatase activity